MRTSLTPDGIVLNSDSSQANARHRVHEGRCGHRALRKRFETRDQFAESPWRRLEVAGHGHNTVRQGKNGFLYGVPPLFWNSTSFGSSFRVAQGWIHSLAYGPKMCRREAAVGAPRTLLPLMRSLGALPSSARWCRWCDTQKCASPLIAERSVTLGFSLSDTISGSLLIHTPHMQDPDQG